MRLHFESASRRAQVREGFRIQGAGCRVQGAGFRVQGSGFRVHDLNLLRICIVLGFRVQGSGRHLGFKIQGSR